MGPAGLLLSVLPLYSFVFSREMAVIEVSLSLPVQAVPFDTDHPSSANSFQYSSTLLIHFSGSFTYTPHPQSYSHILSSQSSLFILIICLYHLSISQITHSSTPQSTPMTLLPKPNLPFVSLLLMHSTLMYHKPLYVVVS